MQPSSYPKVRDNKDNNQKLKVKKQHTTSEDNRVLEYEKWGTLNALGQPAEPICTYYRCNHKFSLHGTRCCRCKHPNNKTLGVAVGYS